jgi:hypothetical protein
MKSINENTVRVAELIVTLAITVANGVKSVIDIFKRKKKTEPIEESDGTCD